MTIYVGGLRTRLIRDSLVSMVTDSLSALGWFDEGRQHAPINVVATGIDPDEEKVPFNTLAFADDDIISDDDELGSLFAEHRWDWFIDFYAEDSSVGLHLIEDVRAILEGRMQSINRDDPSFRVYDYSQNGAPYLFTVGIEDVSRHKAHGFPKAWQKYWYSLNFTVVDHYGDEER